MHFYNSFGDHMLVAQLSRPQLSEEKALHHIELNVSFIQMPVKITEILLYYYFVQLYSLFITS